MAAKSGETATAENAQRLSKAIMDRVVLEGAINEIRRAAGGPA